MVQFPSSSHFRSSKEQDRAKSVTNISSLGTQPGPRGAFMSRGAGRHRAAVLYSELLLNPLPVLSLHLVLSC